ncbi:MAG: sodium:alanine symporter family protein, partial [Clostridia bacterium]|nr:sodium:alanine symporter family protein [Clostridia bacterium]
MIDNINLILFPVVILFLCFSGVFLTFKLKFFQIKHFKAILLSPINFENKNGISSFSAMSTALAGTLGVGNIIGVATAICMGGPGAVFYMILSAFFGMAIKFSEISLSLKYKDKIGNSSI